MATTTSDLDARLRRHHEELISLFGGHHLAPARPRRPMWPVAAGLALVVVAAIAVPLVTLRWTPSHATGRQVQIAGLTITALASDAIAPRLTHEQAIAAVEAFVAAHPFSLPHGGPAVTGLQIDGARFVPDVENVVGPCVHDDLPFPMDVWVVPVSAPAQAGWSGIRGAVLVEDATGNAGFGDLLMAPARFGPPAC